MTTAGGKHHNTIIFKGVLMSLKRRPIAYLVLLLLISFFLTSCGQSAVINVVCDEFELIKAINRANVYPDTNWLILEPDCTYQFDSQDNTYGSHGGNGLPVVTTKIVIEGNNATLDRISSSYGPRFRFFFITDSGNLRLEDITLKHGLAENSAGEQTNSRGGAIYNDGGGLRTERSLFIYNEAQDGEGGAIYNRGILTLDETTFRANQSGNGGAIYNGSTANIAAVLQDVTFEFNLATLNGGAIYNASPEAGFMIVGSTFYWNRSYEHGGVIYMESGDLYVSSSEFLENWAGRFNNLIGDGGVIYSSSGDVTLITTNFNIQKAYGIGGILYAGPGSDVILREVRSEDSKACHGGGALYVEGETEILETTLKKNWAGSHMGTWHSEPGYVRECSDFQGGAIYNTGILAIESSLIENSFAHGDGDGIYNLGVLSIVNSTFHEKTGYTYPRDAICNLGNAQVIFSTLMNAGLVNNGIMDVKNIIVAGNSGGCINAGTFVEWGENIAHDPTCPFSNILTNTNDLGIDPSLSDNGGPTLTHHVADDSPVIDQVRCLTISGDQVIKDQRGVYRPHPLSGGDYSCDIGATEVHYLFDLPQPTPPLDTGPEPSQPCASFEELEYSLNLSSIPSGTTNLTLNIKFLNEDLEIWDTLGVMAYSASLGDTKTEGYQEEGYPNRVYFNFQLPESAPGNVRDFHLFRDDCDNPLISIPRVTIPEQDIPDPDKPSLVCKKVLDQDSCKKAGGTWVDGGTVGASYCDCK
jgi:predicted outer membrane repeat protein